MASQSSPGDGRPAQRLKSGKSTVRSFLRFVNRTQRQVDVIWLNYDGVGIRYKTLQPSGYADVNTFVGHPWFFRDHQTGEKMVVHSSEVFHPPEPHPSPQTRRHVINITIPVYSLRERCLQVCRRLWAPSAISSLEIPSILKRDLLKVPRQSVPVAGVYVSLGQGALHQLEQQVQQNIQQQMQHENEVQAYLQQAHQLIHVHLQHVIQQQPQVGPQVAQQQQQEGPQVAQQQPQVAQQQPQAGPQVAQQQQGGPQVSQAGPQVAQQPPQVAQQPLQAGPQLPKVAQQLQAEGQQLQQDPQQPVQAGPQQHQPDSQQSTSFTAMAHNSQPPPQNQPEELAKDNSINGLTDPMPSCSHIVPSHCTKRHGRSSQLSKHKAIEDSTTHSSSSDKGPDSAAAGPSSSLVGDSQVVHSHQNATTIEAADALVHICSVPSTTVKLPPGEQKNLDGDCQLEKGSHENSGSTDQSDSVKASQSEADSHQKSSQGDLSKKESCQI